MLTNGKIHNQIFTTLHFIITKKLCIVFQFYFYLHYSTEIIPFFRSVSAALIIPNLA